MKKDFCSRLAQLHFDGYKAYYEIYSVENRFTGLSFLQLSQCHRFDLRRHRPKLRRGIMHSFFSRRAILAADRQMIIEHTLSPPCLSDVNMKLKILAKNGKPEIDRECLAPANAGRAEEQRQRKGTF